MIKWLLSKAKSFRSDERGVTTILYALAIPAIFGIAALSIDLSYAYYIKSRLQTAADLGALAGAQLLYKDTEANVNAKALSFVNANLPSGWNGVSSGVNVTKTITAMCNTTIRDTYGLTCDGPSTKNSLKVTLTATTPLFFASALGYRSIGLTAESFVSGAGSAMPPMNIMIVLDTTRSMVTTNTTACGTPSMSKMRCAMQAIRGMLTTLWPSVDHVSLMIYPGVATNTDVQREYCASSGSVVVRAYNASPIYTIISDSTDYNTRTAATTTPTAPLNTTTSNLVKAVGGAATCAGMQSPGGVGTYYAGAITAAQAALTAQNAALPVGQKRQNVIIILSDGDAQAATGGVSQCKNAVVNAAAATAAGTWVYSIAYEALTSGSCSTETAGNPAGYAAPLLQACTAMRNMASDPSKFYSVGGTGCVSASNPTVTNLNNIFKNVATSLMRIRRLPNSNI